MEDAQGRFTFDQIYNYISDGIYPEGFEKGDKLALRKRCKFFIVMETDLYYIGGQSEDKYQL